MASEEPVRSRSARAAAEAALVRVVHHYGATPEFVLLGGLVPDLLCSSSGAIHAGTTDVDVQVDLEIAAGTANGRRLEQALGNAEFTSSDGRVWRWETEFEGLGALVKFELLADMPDVPTQTIVNFDQCYALGAVNLRGTGYAARDFGLETLRSKVGGVLYTVEVQVTQLAGYLLAKTAAAYGRRHPKDYYDLAFVLRFNDAGGPEPAAERVLDRFSDELSGQIRTALDELAANFRSPSDHGPTAFADQFALDHPDEADAEQLCADAVIVVQTFYQGLFAN